MTDKPALFDVLREIGHDTDSRGNTLDPDSSAWQRLYQCPLCGAGNRKFAACLSDGSWKCHGCGDGGDVYRLIMLTQCTDFLGAKDWARDLHAYYL